MSAPVTQPELCTDCEHDRQPAKCHGEITLSEMETIERVAKVKALDRAAKVIEDYAKRYPIGGPEDHRTVVALMARWCADRIRGLP